MISDVPVGVFYRVEFRFIRCRRNDGKNSSMPVKTFCIGFEQEYDERKYARMVAERYKTDHTEMLVKPNINELLPKLAGTTMNLLQTHQQYQHLLYLKLRENKLR